MPHLGHSHAVGEAQLCREAVSAVPSGTRAAHRSRLKEVQSIWMKIFWPVLYEFMTAYHIAFKGFAP